ncbi:D-alanyl-D-alanine carboxypeptidase [Roseococcus sp. SDR]|uniref:D-alanyl-D-alanine carboxypeptidase family protein n=1 Tax=Roseococcus sp. SDR TaxID=2835532 RepID=UPI001BCE4784|nr:D-alanyl-D-alanine carboxypeptidase family protein [Roseococcus sp. SDR]MBS7791453.1 D-alanyl-D-alanine carboxypeptidase [Roseococcus sp. SDR]MBV1846767.1 D-alanyl-D-alanine carboxypeptidase [Roseococcus sp. SDR]
MFRRTMIGASAGLGLAAPALAQNRPPAQPQRPQPARPAGPPSSPAQSPIGPVDTIARSVLLLDFETGATLLNKQADERMPPASMSKLMTMYAVFDQVKAGRLRMDQSLTVSEAAWRMGGSKMFLERGSTATVEELSRGVIIQSGNDACVVLAEHISGSERAFAEMITSLGRQIGLTSSTFRNATGWPDPEHRMTARDLATLARRIIVDHPEFYRFYSERSFRWNNITQENRNPLLGRVAGADGLKTGHTEEAGYGLTASVRRGERRLILVVGGLPTMRARAEESERLMEWGFREFDNVVLFRAADTIEEVPVHLGDRRTVPLIGGREVVATVPRGWRDSLQARIRYEAPVPAPVVKGQELGRLEISGRGVPPMTLPLYAGADVERLGVLARIPAVIGQMMGGRI